MKPVKCIECEAGVDGCDILSDSERTCCFCIWAAGEERLALEVTFACDKCAHRIFQLED